MKKTYLALALLIAGFLLAGNAYGNDEVYYCADNNSNGFRFDESIDSYVRAGFNGKKFKMKMDLPNKKINIVMEIMDNQTMNSSYICTQPYLPGLTSLTCFYKFSMFNFNPDTGRYVLAKGFGYVNKFPDGDYNDDVSISIGKCDKL